MSIGKRLARERDEMCRELRRLHESTLELHDKMIMEIQVLKKDTIGDDSESVIEACNGLHEKWQQNTRQWFSSNLAEAEHKLWIADESWRKSRSHNVSQVQNDAAYAQRNLRDRIDEIKGRSLALPSSSGSVAALASSEEEDLDVSHDYEDLDKNDATTSSGSVSLPIVTSTPGQSGINQSGGAMQRRINANIAQRKKLATPSPSQHPGESRTSLDESLYSSLSNDVYTKIGSPKQHQSLVESGTASVIEVIEPTASEEEEFKKAIQGMNWSASAAGDSNKASPITIFPRDDELRASILTNTSTISNSNHHARPVQVRSPTTSSSKTSSLRSRNSRYSSNGELSPTKRLLEMGIITDNLEDDDTIPDVDKSKSNNKAASFLQKIAKKTSTKLKKRSSPAPPFVYENVNNDQDQGDRRSLTSSQGHNGQVAEEHILPDSFDDDLILNGESNNNINPDNESTKRMSGVGSSGGGVTSSTSITLRANKSSVSPASRKSASSSTSKGSAGSEDSGIGIPVKSNAALIQQEIQIQQHQPPVEANFRLGKIEEASSVASSSTSNHHHKLVNGNGNHGMVKPIKVKKSRENKAWYDVPSDDNTEAPEADSLASIISHRGSSDED